MSGVDSQPPHIIDTLIAERAPRLTGSAFWPLARPAVYAMLGYRKARAMAEAIAPMGGRAAMDYASDLLRLGVMVTGAERIPPAGRVVIVCNHPTGLADGIAVYDALKAARPELMFFANSDAQRVNPRLSEIFIPVEWVEAKRTRERTRLTLASAHAAFEAERALVIFPAGRISVPEHGLLTDPPWAPTAISLARKHRAPILPVHVSGPPSVLFNLLDRVSLELRDITLFHELLNKRGKAFAVTIGPLIPAEAIEDDSAAMTLRLKAYVERTLPGHPDQPFS
jgi:putative hemolysin